MRTALPSVLRVLSVLIASACGGRSALDDETSSFSDGSDAAGGRRTGSGGASVSSGGSSAGGTFLTSGGTSAGGAFLTSGGTSAGGAITAGGAFTTGGDAAGGALETGGSGGGCPFGTFGDGVTCDRSSDAYLMGLLVLSPSLSSGFHYFPFPDEGGPTTWALGTSKSPGDFFLATSATRYEPFHIKHYKRHATSYQEAPAFIALNGSSSSLLLSQQRAFPRKGAMVIAVNGEKGWMLGYPFEHEQDACAQSPLGMVIGDGDSMVTDVAAPRCASAK